MSVPVGEGEYPNSDRFVPGHGLTVPPSCERWVHRSGIGSRALTGHKQSRYRVVSECRQAPLHLRSQTRLLRLKLRGVIPKSIRLPWSANRRKRTHGTLHSMRKMPRPGDPSPGFFVHPWRCFQNIYSPQLQLTHYYEPAPWRGRYTDDRGKVHCVWSCDDHADEIEGVRRVGRPSSDGPPAPVDCHHLDL